MIDRTNQTIHVEGWMLASGEVERLHLQAVIPLTLEVINVENDLNLVDYADLVQPVVVNETPAHLIVELRTRLRALVLRASAGPAKTGDELRGNWIITPYLEEPTGKAADLQVTPRLIEILEYDGAKANLGDAYSVNQTAEASAVQTRHYRVNCQFE